MDDQKFIEELLKLVKETPNDFELGEKVRRYVSKYTQNENNKKTS